MNFKKSKTVTIESPDGRLCLVWRDGSPKRRVMAVGMPNSPPGRALANKIKREIETDLAICESHYDRTLLKYRPQTLGKNATSLSAPELFEKFTQFKDKAKNLSPFTISSKYKAINSKLAKHLDIAAAEVTSYIDLWLKRRAETGDIKPKSKTFSGSNYKIKDWDKFRKFAKTHGDKTQKQRAQRWEDEISERTICRALRKIGFTRKKNLWVPREG